MSRKLRTIPLILSLAMLAQLCAPAYAQEIVICKRTEHIHDENCYEHRLVCDKEVTPAHRHSSECWLCTEELICPLSEGEVTHTHTDSCYAEREILICDLEESPSDAGHTHDATCFAEDGSLVCEQSERPPQKGHTHNADCFTTEKILVCNLSDAPHEHSENCYIQKKELICGLEETEGHVHSDSCYERVGEPICGLEEHIHSKENGCISDTKADVEEPEDWDRMLAKLTYTGSWDEDILTVAKSQLGYCASDKNFAFNESGIRCGYTRFAHWFALYHGMTLPCYRYEFWCADFASFCVHFAGIPEQYIPLNKNCACWVTMLREKDYFVEHLWHMETVADDDRTIEPNQSEKSKTEETDADKVGSEKKEIKEKDPAENKIKNRIVLEYTPKPGDLVFFDYNGDKRSTHVGIVESVDIEEGILYTIEGNNGDAVRRCKYDLTYAGLFGFCDLQKAFSEYKADAAEKERKRAAAAERKTKAIMIALELLEEEQDAGLMNSHT